MTQVLTIIVMVASLGSPKNDQSVRVYLPFPTQYTCEAALKQLDTDAIKATVARVRKLDARRVLTSCEPAGSSII